MLGKWNGAVGNFNAHVSAAPDLDWPAINRSFVESPGLEHNPYTTQIEPHDWIAEYCDAIAAIDTVLIDLCRDFWGYISLGYFRSAAERERSRLVDDAAQGESRSISRMPRAISGRERAAATLRGQAADLRAGSAISPDSTVLRNLGVALAHSLIGWRSWSAGSPKSRRARPPSPRTSTMRGSAGRSRPDGTARRRRTERLRAPEGSRPADRPLMARP